MIRDDRDTLIEPLAHQEGVRKIYRICADDGAPVALHVRIQSPGQKKRFAWQQPDGSNGLSRPISELPLYGTEQLPGLESGRLVVVTEGEKAADALRVLGIPAVGTVTGAAGCPSDDVLATLDGFDVAVWPDADTQGRKHAAKLLDGLLRTREGKAEGLFAVDPAALGLTAKGADADDWRPKDPIDDLFVTLKPYAPPPVLEPSAPTTTTQRIVIKGGKTRAGLLAALDHLAIDLRYDERSARIQFRDATADFPKWTNSDDMCRAELRERIADKFLYVTKDGKAPLAFSKDRFSDVIDALLNSRRIDPFKEWLDALPEWDGEKRLDFWLTGCFQIGDIDPKLLRWASYSVLMGAVMRTYAPGEKHDEVVILVGPQGLGKSTVWAWLLPPADRRAWFSDALKFPRGREGPGRGAAGPGDRRGGRNERVDARRGRVDEGVSGPPRRRRRPAHLPPRPYRPSPPLHHRRLDQRPPLSPERPLWAPPLCAGPGNGRGPSQDPEFRQRISEATVGRGTVSITRAQRAGVAARRVEATTGRAHGTVPGDR